MTGGEDDDEKILKHPHDRWWRSRRSCPRSARTRSSWRSLRKRQGRGKKNTKSRSSRLTSSWSRQSLVLNMLRWTSANFISELMIWKMRSSERKWRSMLYPLSLMILSQICSIDIESTKHQIDQKNYRKINEASTFLEKLFP